MEEGSALPCPCLCSFGDEQHWATETRATILQHTYSDRRSLLWNRSHQCNPWGMGWWGNLLHYSPRRRNNGQTHARRLPGYRRDNVWLSNRPRVDRIGLVYGEHWTRLYHLCVLCWDKLLWGELVHHHLLLVIPVWVMYDCRLGIKDWHALHGLELQRGHGLSRTREVFGVLLG